MCVLRIDNMHQESQHSGKLWQNCFDVYLGHCRLPNYTLRFESSLKFESALTRHIFRSGGWGWGGDGRTDRMRDKGRGRLIQ